MRRIVTAALAFGLAAFITAPKLYKMGQIKGWLPGASTRTETITAKWHQLAREQSGRRMTRRQNVWWISWGTASIREVGDHRLNLEQEAWENLKVGDRIELISVGPDSSPHIANDIFVSQGNFVFDIVLLVVEIGVGLWAAWPWRIERSPSAVG